MSEKTRIHWLTEEETSELKAGLQGDLSSEAEGILQELIVSSKRVKGTKLPVEELGHALGLKGGSVPIWLTDKEHDLVNRIIKK